MGSRASSRSTGLRAWAPPRATRFDEFPHAVERMPPAEYLAASYYREVAARHETLVREKGLTELVSPIG